MEKEKARFLTAYAKVPEPLRDEIIVVVNKKTYTWDTTYFEIKQKTKLAENILKTLVNTELI
ncbi:MAG: hypothetical protein IIA85_00355 [Nanoarchaeota archaeon]|nr:hypothetical protein [Nanoarchaeota archaeon]